MTVNDTNAANVVKGSLSVTAAVAFLLKRSLRSSRIFGGIFVATRQNFGETNCSLSKGALR